MDARLLLPAQLPVGPVAPPSGLWGQGDGRPACNYERGRGLSGLVCMILGAVGFPGQLLPSASRRLTTQSLIHSPHGTPGGTSSRFRVSPLLSLAPSSAGGSTDAPSRLGPETRGGASASVGREGKGRKGVPWGFLFAIKQEPWVFLRGFEDTYENLSILSHCWRQLMGSTHPCALLEADRLHVLLSAPRPRQQHMEFHNLSAAPARCLPASSPRVAAFLAPVLGAEFVLGLLGNSLALFIFCARTRPWTSNVVFLVSLVAADFLLVASLPLRVDYYLHREAWRFGAAACRASLFLLTANRSASAAFLTAIALHRYLKVVWPHHALSRASGRAAARVAGALWAGILLLHGHLLLAAPPEGSCISYQLGASSRGWQGWHQALYFLEFSLSLALILFAIASIWGTIRRRGLGGQAGPRRALRVLAAVVAVYTTCFLPSVLLGAASIVAFRLRACRALGVCSQLFHGSLAFTYLNSVLDPALYCFSSPGFFRQCQALLGLARGPQGPASDESSSQPPGRPQEASRR